MKYIQMDKSMFLTVLLVRYLAQKYNNVTLP